MACPPTRACTSVSDTTAGLRAQSCAPLVSTPRPEQFRTEPSQSPLPFDNGSHYRCYRVHRRLPKRQARGPPWRGVSSSLARQLDMTCSVSSRSVVPDEIAICGDLDRQDPHLRGDDRSAGHHHDREYWHACRSSRRHSTVWHPRRVHHI